MTIDKNDIKALHLEMTRVLSETDYVIRNWRGQKKANHLIEQDIRHLRDQLIRLDKHLGQLQQLPIDVRKSALSVAVEPDWENIR